MISNLMRGVALLWSVPQAIYAHLHINWLFLDWSNR